MNQEELAQRNVGQDLDDLANLDPRGYGVCRILYAAARKYTGEPLGLHAAKLLNRTVKEGDLVYLMTGFVLPPSNCAETDGIIGAMHLARALVKAFGAKPVIICPQQNLPAVKNLSAVVGMHFCETIAEVKKYPAAMTAVVFTKDAVKAADQADAVMAQGLPSAVVSIEYPGANRLGVYHNAVGKDVTALQAKADILFEKLQRKGVLNISIGDLGNELGMGTIGEHLNRFIPYAGPGACSCGCGGGLAAATKADNIITATVSNWGCYAMIASLAFLRKDAELFQDGELEKEVITTASRSHMINMDGWLTPAVDGFDLKMNVLIVELMRECVTYALHYEHFEPGKIWFNKVLELGFYKR